MIQAPLRGGIKLFGNIFNNSIKTAPRMLTARTVQAAVKPKTRVHSEEQWLETWENNHTPWYKTEVDKNLKNYINLLTKKEHYIKVFVPWCGKSLDLLWLCDQGHYVTGAELSHKAARELFEENFIPYSVKKEGEFDVYYAGDRELKIIVGSMFNLSPKIAGMHDAIWDCCALGTANPSDRERHIQVLLSVLKPSGTIMARHLEFDHSEYPGSPFSLSSTQMKDLFGKNYQVDLVKREDLAGTAEAKEFNLSWVDGLVHTVNRIWK